MAADDPRNPDDGDPNDSATELAARIADGSMIDWPEGADDATHLGAARVEQLKAIAAIADLRRVTADDGLGTPAARTWGTLAIVGRIGAGQFGEVFRAWDTKLQREVALKILKHPGSQDPLAPSRAIEEARHLARVRHPNVLTVYGAEQIGDRTGIWTELIEGQTLELLVTKQGPLPEREVVAVGLDLSRALAAVHAAGIVHRDVKAQNVMREVGGRVVLMDFGTGINLSGGTKRARDLSGTPLYLAPEIFAGATPNTSTDLYALAVLLFHLLTGVYPVQGATLDEVRTNHESGNRRRVRDLAPAVSKPVAELIDRGLSDEPEQRHRDAGDLEHALLAAAPPTQAKSSSVASPRRNGRRWFLAASIAACIAVLVAVGVWPYFRPTKNQPAELVCDRCVQSGVQVRGSAVSPDGRWLAVADAVSGDFLIRDLQTGRVRSLGVSAAMPYFAPPSAKRGYPSSPVFFPDSRRLAFIWIANPSVRRHKIWTIDIFTGDSQQVTHSDEDVGPIYDVAPDGKSILVAVFQPMRFDRGLAWVSLEGVIRTVKASWEKFTLTGKNGFMQLPRSARVSPDGRFIAYAWEPATAVVSGRRVRHIYIANSDGSTQREAVISDADNSSPTWNARGDRLYFTSDVSGAVDLWSVAVQDGAAVGPLTLARPNIGEVSSLFMNSDGWARYVGSESPRDFIFITDMTRASVPTDRPIERIIAGTLPSWTDDGKVLRFFRRRSRSSAPVPWTLMTFTVADGRESVDQSETAEAGSRTYSFSYVARTLGPATSFAGEALDAFLDSVKVVPYSVLYGPAAPETGYRADYEAMDIALAHKLVGPSLYAFRSDSTGDVRVSAIVAIDVASHKVRPVCVLPNRPPGRREVDSVGLSLSPDSRRLALSLWAKGRATLGILEISTCEYRQIYGPFPTQSTAHKVGWSPDSQSVLISEEFGEASGVGYQILRVPLGGGLPESIIRLNGTDRQTSFALNVDGLLAFHPNPAFDQPFAPTGASSFQLWRLDLKGAR